MFAQQSIVRHIVLLQQLCKSDLIMHWHPAIRGKPMKQQKHTYLHSFQPLGNGALHVLEWHHVHLRSFGSRLVKPNTLCLKHSMEIVYGCSSSLMQHPVATTCMQNLSIKLFQAKSSVNQGFHVSLHVSLHVITPQKYEGPGECCQHSHLCNSACVTTPGHMY